MHSYFNNLAAKVAGRKKGEYNTSMKDPKNLDNPSSKIQGWGGAREGAGGKPSWFRQEARKALAGLPPYSKNKIEWLSTVADGSEYEHKADKDGNLLSQPVGVKDRLKACEMLGKWAALEVTKVEGGGDEDGAPIQINPYAGVTSKEDLLTLEAILKRAKSSTTTTADQEG